jgi:ribonuclease D
MTWQLIESDSDLLPLLERASRSPVVMVDTEFMRRNTFYPQVALVQLCIPGEGSEPTAWLIDPLAIEDPGPLGDLLVNPGVVKVLHSASEDLEVFQRWLGALPDPLFDTQRAAALSGLGFGMGYRALVHEICDVDLPKGETRSDWLQRPLTESQCDYAAQDVTWLLPVWEVLDERCRAQDKLEWVLSDGRDATANLATTPGDYYKRIKSAWKLKPRQLGALEAICAWREDTARARDKPRNWIIDDKTCLQLAQADPRSPAQMRSSVELPPPVQRRYGDALLALLEQQRSRAESELPPSLPGPLDARQRDRLKKLKSGARDLAESLGVAPEALLPGKDYELLLRESDGEVVSAPGHWRGWRAETVIEPLRQLLAESRR